MNYLELAKDGWKALKAGEVVADPAAWKKKQVSVNQVAAALGALLLFAKVAGYDLHVDGQTEAYVAGGIYGVVNWVLTVVTTDKIGIMGQRTDVAVAHGDGAAGGSPASVRDAPGAPVGGVAADPRAPVAVRRGSDDPAQSDQYAGGPG